MKRTFTLILTLCCMSIMADTRIALVANSGKPGKIVDLATVALSKSPEITILDRSVITKQLQEQTLSLAGYMTPETVVKAGQLLKADLIAVFTVDEQMESALEVIVFDTVLGVRYWDSLIQGKTDNELSIRVQHIVTCIETAVTKHRKAKNGTLTYVSLPTVRNVNLPRHLKDSFPQAVQCLLLRRLCSSPDLVVLERHHLEHFNKERDLVPNTDLQRIKTATQALELELEWDPQKAKVKGTVLPPKGERIVAWVDEKQPAACLAHALADGIGKAMKIRLRDTAVPHAVEARRLLREYEALSKSGIRAPHLLEAFHALTPKSPCPPLINHLKGKGGKTPSEQLDNWGRAWRLHQRWFSGDKLKLFAPPWGLSAIEEIKKAATGTAEEERANRLYRELTNHVKAYFNVSRKRREAMTVDSLEKLEEYTSLGWHLDQYDKYPDALWLDAVLPCYYDWIERADAYAEDYGFQRKALLPYTAQYLLCNVIRFQNHRSAQRRKAFGELYQRMLKSNIPPIRVTGKYSTLLQSADCTAKNNKEWFRVHEGIVAFTKRELTRIGTKKKFTTSKSMCYNLVSAPVHGLGFKVNGQYPEGLGSISAKLFDFMVARKELNYNVASITLAERSPNTDPMALIMSGTESPQEIMAALKKNSAPTQSKLFEEKLDLIKKLVDSKNTHFLRTNKHDRGLMTHYAALLERGYSQLKSRAPKLLSPWKGVRSIKSFRAEIRPQLSGHDLYVIRSGALNKKRLQEQGIPYPENAYQYLELSLWKIEIDTGVERHIGSSVIGDRDWTLYDQDIATTTLHKETFAWGSGDGLYVFPLKAGKKPFVIRKGLAGGRIQSFCIVGDNVYLFCGGRQDEDPSYFYRMDWTSKSLTLLCSSSSKTKTAPICRSGGAFKSLGAIADPKRSRFVTLIDGFYLKWKKKGLWEYNVDTKAWKKLKVRFPDRLNPMAMRMINGRVLIYGLSVCCLLDLETDTIKLVTPPTFKKQLKIPHVSGLSVLRSNHDVGCRPYLWGKGYLWCGDRPFSRIDMTTGRIQRLSVDGKPLRLSCGHFLMTEDQTYLIATCGDYPHGGMVMKLDTTTTIEKGNNE